MNVAGERTLLRWGFRVLGASVLLLAMGQLLMTRSVDLAPNSPEAPSSAPPANLAFHMEQVPMPPPPPSLPAPRRAEAAAIDDGSSSTEEVMQVTATSKRPEPAARAGAGQLPDAAAPAGVDHDAGEQLLAKAERGELDPVRIAWPESPEERARLDAWLHDCVGVRNALLHRNTLVASEPDVGAAPSRRFSGLVRQIEGVPIPAEARRLAMLRAGGATGVGVRLFPREFDRLLLGTLSGMGALRPGAQIRYRFRDRLVLEVNGRKVDMAAMPRSECGA